MKKLLLVFILFVCFVNADASDTLSSNPTKNHRFRVGVSFCLISNAYWTSTDSLIIESHSKKGIPITSSLLRPFGLTIGYKIYKNIYVQTGGSLSEHYIKELGDHDDTGLRVGKRTVFLSYRNNFFQLPVSVAYTVGEKKSLYLSTGVKFNFIYYEHLYGKDNPTYTFNPSSSTGYTATYQDVNIVNNDFKFKSIVPYINVGGILWTKKRRLGLIFSMFMDFPPLHNNPNTITNYWFQDFSLFNLQLIYSF